MTKEEAIRILKNFSLCGVYHQLIHMNDTDSEAISMAIKALEQPEPCEDAVSRKLMYELGATCIARRENGELVALAGLDTLPSVTPKRKTAKWIATTSLQEGQITWRDYKCSNCSHHREKPMNFCEVCGRKMER